MKDRSMKMFMMICRKTQKELKEFLCGWLKKYYSEIISNGGYLYAKGTDNVLLTAHMDTVHKVQCNKIDVDQMIKPNKRALSSKDGIGGDDRCGVFMIMRIIETTKLRPSILFCEDEEVGGVGSRKFCETEFIKDIEKMLFLVELDRAHDKDLVYYHDGNKEFQDFCSKVTGYTKAYGTFSDISNLSPKCKVSSVNISCGYYNPHKTNEYVVWEEMCDSIDATIKLITEGLAQGKAYEYKETFSYSAYYGYGKHSYYDYSDYDYGYGNKYGNTSQKKAGYYDSNYWDDYDDEYDLENGYGNTYTKKATSLYDNREWMTYEFIDINGRRYYSAARSMREALGDVIMENKTLSWEQIATWTIVNGKVKEAI